MFTPVWTPEATKKYEELKSKALASKKARKSSKKKKSSKAEGLFKQVNKCITNLLQNPKHPGLSTHEYHSLSHPYNKNDKVFEAYVQSKTPAAYRVFWCYGPERRQITFISITPHS